MAGIEPMEAKATPRPVDPAAWKIINGKLYLKL
jgi:hypothetical protein